MYNCKMSADENTQFLLQALRKNAIYQNAKSRMELSNRIPQFSSPEKANVASTSLSAMEHYASYNSKNSREHGALSAMSSSM